MFYGVDLSGNIVEAVSGRVAFCPGCKGELQSKCGEIKIHHWAHKQGCDCDSWAEPETEWHKQWKDLFPIETREKFIPSLDGGMDHRADVCLGDPMDPSKRLVIEVQHSSISVATVRERESFYGNMIWLIDAKYFGKSKKEIEEGKKGFTDRCHVAKVYSPRDPRDFFVDIENVKHVFHDREHPIADVLMDSVFFSEKRKSIEKLQFWIDHIESSRIKKNVSDSKWRRLRQHTPELTPWDHCVSQWLHSFVLSKFEHLLSEEPDFDLLSSAKYYLDGFECNYWREQYEGWMQHHEVWEEKWKERTKSSGHHLMHIGSDQVINICGFDVPCHKTIIKWFQPVDSLLSVSRPMLWDLGMDHHMIYIESASVDSAKGKGAGTNVKVFIVERKNAIAALLAAAGNSSKKSELNNALVAWQQELNSRQAYAELSKKTAEDQVTQESKAFREKLEKEWNAEPRVREIVAEAIKEADSIKQQRRQAEEARKKLEQEKIQRRRQAEEDRKKLEQAPLKIGVPLSGTNISIGETVTNLKGWHGRVTRVEYKPNSYQHDKLYVWVYWTEREKHHDKLVARQPICGHTTSQLWRPLES